MFRCREDCRAFFRLGAYAALDQTQSCAMEDSAKRAGELTQLQLHREEQLAWSSGLELAALGPSWQLRVKYLQLFSNVWQNLQCVVMLSIGQAHRRVGRHFKSIVYPR